MSISKKFKVDARVILNLGRHSIKDHTTALVELVKNSYDADALNVEVCVHIDGSESFIRVADNGCGMSDDQLNNNWLRIGYSDKTSEKFSPEKKRRKTGEKGIGRISADRLGSAVKVISKVKGAKASSLTVNWDDFDVEGKDIEDIQILMDYDATISIPLKEGAQSSSGTELIITGLRQEWTKANVESLYEELSVLTPPFESSNDFSIKIDTNIKNDFAPKVDSGLYLSSEIEVELNYDGHSPDFIYSIKDKYHKGHEKTETINWRNLVSKVDGDVLDEIADYPKCGPINLKLWFYPRTSATVSGTEFTLSSLREFLDNNAGIKIYRDGVAVKPYGFKQGQADWLGLAERKAADPAGISRESYKITPNQLVGAIFISRDKNQKLIDSSAREGLIDSEGLFDLKLLTIGVINLLETHRFNLNKEINAQQNKPNNKDKISTSSRQTVKQIRDDFNTVKKKLEEVEAAVPRNLAAPLRNSIEKFDRSIEETEKTVEIILNENRVLSGLATLGIASAVFGHETQSALSTFNTSIKNVKGLLSRVPLKFELIEKEADKALKYSKRISSWGSFALTRVQTEKRRLSARNIKSIIESTLDEMKPSLLASSIDLEIKAEHIVSKTYPMDIESIMVNLITNAFTACLNVSRSRKICVTLLREDKENTSGYKISVADSGPGIHKDFIDRIWEPLFSTRSNNSSKKVGTGLGLTIVKSIVSELEGVVDVGHDTQLKGALFTIWLPKI